MRLLIRSTQKLLCAIDASPNESVSEFKDEIAEKTNLPREGMILIHDGKAMNDEFTIETFNLRSGQSLIVVIDHVEKKPIAKKQKIYNPNKQFQYQMMKMMLSMVKKDPEGYFKFLENFPGFKSVIEKNPDFRFAMDDPDMMEELIEVLFNPDNSEQGAITFDRMLNYIESYPSGTSLLNKTINSIQNPLLDSINDQIHQTGADITRIPIEELQAPSEKPLPETTSKTPQNNIFMNFFSQGNYDKPLAKEGISNIQKGIQMCKDNGFNIEGFLIPGKTLIPEKPKNSQMQQNPMMFVDPFSSMNFGGDGMQPSLSKEELKTLYSRELDIMSDMGFKDTDKNLEVLTKTNGNVERAINLLVETQNLH